MAKKKWYTSKMLWVNVIAALAGIIQGVTGTAVMDPQAQVGILGLINVVLRLITKTGLSA